MFVRVTCDGRSSPLNVGRVRDVIIELEDGTMFAITTSDKRGRVLAVTKLKRSGAVVAPVTVTAATTGTLSLR